MEVESIRVTICSGVEMGGGGGGGLEPPLLMEPPPPKFVSLVFTKRCFVLEIEFCVLNKIGAPPSKNIFLYAIDLGCNGGVHNRGQSSSLNPGQNVSVNKA